MMRARCSQRTARGGRAMCAHWCTWLVGSAHAAHAVKNVGGHQPGARLRRHQPGRRQQRQREQRDVAVQIEEAAAEHVVRVDVVDTERAQEARPDHRPRLVPPGIRDPVDDARREVGDHAGGQHHDRQPPGQPDRRGKPDDQQRQRGRGRDEAGELDGLDAREPADRAGGAAAPVGGRSAMRAGRSSMDFLGARRRPISRSAGRGPSRRRGGRRTAGRPAPWDPRSSRSCRRAASPAGSSSDSRRQRYRHLRTGW